MKIDATSVEEQLERCLQYIRPGVRQVDTYRVGGPRNLSIKLNQNESPFELPEELKRSILERFLEIPWNRYPSEQPEALIQALSAFLGHPAEGILVGNGSNELTYTLGLCLVQPGEKVVLPQPMFSLYTKIARMYGGTLISIPPRDDLHFDMEHLLKAVHIHRPSLVVLTTPNNPTGFTLSADDVRAVLKAAPGFVVIDEAYVEFVGYPGFLPWLQEFPHLILLRTFSKAFGLAGLRIGYLLGHPRVIRELLRSRLPFMVDRLAETVAITLLEHHHLIKERVNWLRAERERLRATLLQLPEVEVPPSQTNFLIFRTPLPAATVVGQLAKEQVLVRDVSGYPGMERFLRVNVGTEAENRRFLDALKKTLYSTG